jgi:hypothetical protein
LEKYQAKLALARFLQVMKRDFLFIAYQVKKDTPLTYHLFSWFGVADKDRQSR